MQIRSSRATGAALLIMTCALYACGGGGGSGGNESTADSSQAQSDSASATAMSQEATASAQATVFATQALAADANAGTPVNCPGGGTAQYTLTGGADDSSITAGEVYTLTFNQCTGYAGAATLNGQASLTVTNATLTQMSASVAFTGLSATLPHSTDTLNGSAALTTSLVYTHSGQALNTTVDTKLTASSLAVTRATASHSTTYALSAVNITHSTSFVAGVITDTSVQGTATVSATLPSGTYSATFDAQGAVNYTNGLPTSGSWIVVLPQNSLALSAVPGTVTVALDIGKNGTVDKTWTFVAGTWAAAID